LEWLTEKAIFLVSLSAILMIFLIFIFIGREALPVFLGHTNTAEVKVIPAADMDKLSPEEVRQYLGLSRDDFKTKAMTP